jgi:hypothetical protein
VKPGDVRCTLPRVGRRTASAARAAGAARVIWLAAAGALAVCIAPGCSLGSGTGSVTGTLDVPGCWSGPFDLNPDFFAAVPSAGTATTPTNTDALQIRVQNGGDYETFSDGLAILVDDAGEVRGDPLPDGTPRPSLLNQTLVVALAAGVTPPGVPIEATAVPSIVHASLYLDRTCRTQNVALYALSAVSLNPDGTCERPDGGDPPLNCGAPAATVPAAGAAGADAGADAGPAPEGGVSAPVGTSTIVFQSLFDGNPNESNAKQRLTQATFEFFLADPREICPGGLGPPPRCRGHLVGNFKFYFQAGVPAQPFQ